MASYPRSGSTYFRLVARQCFGIETTSVYPEEKRPAWTAETNGGIELVKTHKEWTAAENGYSPSVLLVRDGRDAMVSYAHFKRDLEGDQRPYELVLQDLVESDGWRRQVESWWDADIDVVMLKYRDLVATPKTAVMTALAAVEPSYLMRIDPDVDIPAPRFEDLHRVRPMEYRRGVVGSHEDEMPKHLEEEFWRRNGDLMERLGFDR